MAKVKKQLHTKGKAISAPTVTTGKGLVIILSIITALVSVSYSNVAIEPGIAIRYLLLSLGCLVFALYFFLVKKYTVPAQYPLLIKAIFIFSFLYLIWNAISLNFSVNAYTGLYELFRYALHIALLFLIMETVRRASDQLLFLCKVITAVSILHSFIGIMQFFEIAFLNLPGSNAQPFGLMSNRNLYGSAQAFVLPFVFYTWFRSTGSWKIVALTALSFLVISILVSQTRSAWIATAFIILSFLVFMVIYLKDYRKRLLKWATVGLVSAVLLILVTLILTSASGVENTITERALSITTGEGASTATEQNVSSRVNVWEKTFLLIKDHPVWGTGLNNWKIIVPLYGSAGTGWDLGTYVPDRAHNVYLQVMAESGIPGFVFYFGIWAMVILAGLLTLRKEIPAVEKVWVALMMAGMIGFASDCMFSFPAERIEHSLFQLIMMGSIMGFYIKNTLNNTSQKPMPLLIKTGVLLFAVANIFMAYKKYGFDAAYKKAKDLETSGRYADAIAEVEKEKSKWITLTAEGSPLEMRSGLSYKALGRYMDGITEMEQALKYNPNNPVAWVNIGTIYTDMKNYPKAIEYYEKALAYAPGFEIARVNLAVNYFEVGKFKETAELLEKVDFTKYPELRNIQNAAKAKLPR